MERLKIWKPVLDECPDKRDLDAHATGRMIHHEIELGENKIVRCEADPGNEEKGTLAVTKPWLRAAVTTLRGLVGATA